MADTAYTLAQRAGAGHNAGMRIMHYVSLARIGGVESQFQAFLTQTAGRGVRQDVVVCSARMHPFVVNAVRRHAASVAFEKRLHGIRLPRRPYWIRCWHQRRLATRHAPSVALLWNRMDQQLRVIEALGAPRSLYWEHGSAWLPGFEAQRQAVARRLLAALCNSRAAERMLRLRWGFQGEARVCLNALRFNLRPYDGRARRLVFNRPLRLGMAARLIALKGISTALYTMRELKDRGLDCTLAIAGCGPQYEALMALRRRLGLEREVTLLGLVQNMRDFYVAQDILLHPALREPFGVVCLEALAYGCPVIASGVDGLPEVVRHGHTGLCLPPTLPVTDECMLGGSRKVLPPYVYDPLLDRIGPPRVMDCAHLADAVEGLVNDPDRYARFSQAAIEDVRTRFDFDRHVTEVLDAVAWFSKTGALGGEPAHGVPA